MLSGNTVILFQTRMLHGTSGNKTIRCKAAHNDKECVVQYVDIVQIVLIIRRFRIA